ncbi:MAG: hypothetical protein DRP71_17140 [Verrucomicrobia bacterium]|nr:MAG: hypothetical protein DRP71_17140 [Verrucomicrobiota bacterium]
MRRPQDNRTQSNGPLNLNSRRADGSFDLTPSQVQAGSVVRSMSPGRESETRESDPSVRDVRPTAGLTTTEVRPGSSASSSSLQAPRQAEAASVLENLHRMAEQATARSQNRMSMTLRLEDGSSIRIRLVREGGKFHTVIHTDLPGMETALRQNWSQFSQDAGDRGFKFMSMSFADLGGSPDRDRTSSGDQTASEFSEIVSETPASKAAVSSVESDSRRSNRHATASTNGSGQLRAWV